jgi:hypothetical protein
MLTLPQYFIIPASLLEQFTKLLERKALYCRQLYDKKTPDLPEADARRLQAQIAAIENEVDVLYRVHQLLAGIQADHDAKLAELATRFQKELRDSEHRHSDLLALYTVANAVESELLQLIQAHISCAAKS